MNSRKAANRERQILLVNGWKLMKQRSPAEENAGLSMNHHKPPKTLNTFPAAIIYFSITVVLLIVYFKNGNIIPKPAGMLCIRSIPKSIFKNAFYAYLLTGIFLQFGY